MTYLTRNDTEETRFYERIAQQRKDHEAALDRLESKLCNLQERRIAREGRQCSGLAMAFPAPATATPSPDDRWRSAALGAATA